MSTKTMTLTEISKTDKKFKDTHTLQVGGFGKGKNPPSWFVEFANEVMARFDKQEKINELILARIDNLVAKNNLKE